MNNEVLNRNLTIYRNEIWAITNSILSLRDRLLASNALILCSDSENNIISPDIEPHEIISSILNNASRLEKLFVIANQRDKETQSEYDFRRERGQLLRKIFLSKQRGVRELFKTSARNSIEHFDERIDVLMNKLIEGDINVKEKLILYNLTLNYKDYFDSWELVLPIKVLVTQSLEYYIVNSKMEKEFIDLNKIFKEVEKMQKKVQLYVDNKFPEGSQDRIGPVGIFIPIKH